jgi:hypothetical protein
MRVKVPIRRIPMRKDGTEIADAVPMRTTCARSDSQYRPQWRNTPPTIVSRAVVDPDFIRIKCGAIVLTGVELHGK